jgi:hypothetical protein
MNVKHVPVFGLIALLAILSGVPLLSSGITNFAHARYATNTQTQTNSNKYDNGACGIIGQLIEADGTANSPIMHVTSSDSQGQQGPPGPQGIQGEQGPAGPAGPNKMLQTRIVESDVGIFPPEPNFSFITATIIVQAFAVCAKLVEVP